MDEQTCLRALEWNLARPLSSHEQRIARGCFAWDIVVGDVVAMAGCDPPPPAAGVREVD